MEIVGIIVLQVPAEAGAGRMARKGRPDEVKVQKGTEGGHTCADYRRVAFY